MDSDHLTTYLYIFAYLCNLSVVTLAHQTPASSHENTALDVPIMSDVPHVTDLPHVTDKPHTMDQSLVATKA